MDTDGSRFDSPPGGRSAPPPTPQRRRGLSLPVAVGLAIGAYVVVVVGFLLAGYRAFVWKTPLVPVLLLVALAGNRFRTFIQDWIVFLAGVVLFDAMRGYIFAASAAAKRFAYVDYPIQWEQALFGWPALGLPIQHWAGQSGAWQWLTAVAIPIHASHFAFFLLFGLALWAANRRDFGRWALVMLLMMAAGIACYALVPTVPPWLASRQGRIPRLVYIAGEAYNANVPALKTIFATNPVAAMPSLHTAFPTCCALAACRTWGWRGIWVWLYTAAMAFSLLYLGEHYMVDILVGWLLGMTAWAVVTRWTAAMRWMDDLGWCRWPASRHFTAAAVIVLAAVLLSSWSTFLLPGVVP